MSVLDDWEAEFKNIQNQLSKFVGDDHPLKQFLNFGCQRGLALIEIVRKKDEQFVHIRDSNSDWATNTEYCTFIIAKQALALTEELK